ncbi:MAG: hypothetical protein M2R45_04816 [Verrucomicrobia subdivision 3 bacterium]|nr:hypothetical protein [Limisphaerales bacterium]MCS1417295.1 hypothetical protein [Limisphaerales bacterium]
MIPHDHQLKLATLGGLPLLGENGSALLENGEIVGQVFKLGDEWKLGWCDSLDRVLDRRR